MVDDLDSAERLCQPRKAVIKIPSFRGEDHVEIIITYLVDQPCVQPISLRKNPVENNSIQSN